MSSFLDTVGSTVTVGIQSDTAIVVITDWRYNKKGTFPSKFGLTVIYQIISKHRPEWVIPEVLG